MTPEHAFLWSIKESPDDDGLRLIFADWLDDNGQPERAELLRLQVGLAQLPIGDLHRVELQKRVNELLAAHERQWLGPWAEVGQFLGGGLISIRCRAERLPELLAAAAGAAADAGAGGGGAAVRGGRGRCRAGGVLAWR
jgi:uncharacterized protein (TIGR02996 family)